MLVVWKESARSLLQVRFLHVVVVECCLGAGSVLSVHKLDERSRDPCDLRTQRLQDEANAREFTCTAVDA